MRHKAPAAAGALAVSALLLLTACSGTEAPPAESSSPEDVSGTVTFWPYPLGGVKEASWWQPYIEKFNETYPKVKIDLQMQAFAGREEALVTAISGGNEPDVVYFNPDFVPKYAAEDLLLPLDDLRDDWDKFHDSALEAMTYDGTLYSAPQLMTAGNDFCNTVVLKAAGGVPCPTTWEEIKEIAPAVKDSGNFVTNYYGTGTLNSTFYKYLWQAGGDVLNKDMTEATFNSAEGVKALTFIKELADNEWVPREEVATIPPFEQSQQGLGKVAYNGGGNIVANRDLHGADAIETVATLKDVKQVASGTVGGWSIFNTTEAPEASQAWVRFLTDVDFMSTLLPEANYYSPRSDITGLYADDPIMAAGEEAIPFVRTGVASPKAREIIDLLKPHIQLVLLEGADPQKELDAAAEEVNRIL
ncbi:multiple sugar transport system substrate-binding protein [Microbacterium sp. W4I4]|uniref:extracellular solute-binding protein n=1 Tax=Microbacterium sp. W4I4 TaxID=3042295 RepID=UPI00278A3BD8|nr:extracellular solute-binding protein [Microbacterium sp. W4I4]MDQ0614468.1 multiple sugar transport system substrate-binding protein [Microbacterium sp. W4I4]